MMTFVGTYEYLKKTRTIGKNGYLYRQPDFSGAVLAGIRIVLLCFVRRMQWFMEMWIAQ